LKRKIRIANGGLQTLFRLPALMNPFRFGLISFQYISHKVLRWTLVPLCFLVLFLLNAAILLLPDRPDCYLILFLLQIIFYILVLAGALLHNVKIRFKPFFAPYYLVVMNYAVIAGMIRYFSGTYTVNWEKARRS